MNEHNEPNEPDHVLLHVNAHGGYAPDQITDTITLRELIEALEQAAADHGEDARVVLHDGGNRYGANYGGISRWNDVVTGPWDDEQEAYL